MSTIEYMTEFMRTELDWLQKEKVEVLEWAGIPRKDLFASLSLLRECMTTMKKHYPKAPEIYKEYGRLEPRLSVSNIENAQTMKHPVPSNDVLKIKNFLTYPEKFHETWGDRVEEHFMVWEKWCNIKITREHLEHINDDHFILEWNEEIEKKWRKQYEKEKKEWEKEHGN